MVSQHLRLVCYIQSGWGKPTYMVLCEADSRYGLKSGLGSWGYCMIVDRLSILDWEAGGTVWSINSSS